MQTCPSTCWPGRTRWRAAEQTGPRWRPLQSASLRPGWWCRGTAGWTGTGSWYETLPPSRSLCWSEEKQGNSLTNWLCFIINLCNCLFTHLFTAHVESETMNKTWPENKATNSYFAPFLLGGKETIKSSLSDPPTLIYLHKHIYIQYMQFKQM